MIIKKRFTDDEFSLKDAVGRVLDGSDYENGELEEIKQTLENQTEFLKNLTNILYNKHVLEHRDIEELLKSEYDLEVVGC